MNTKPGCRFIAAAAVAAVTVLTLAAYAQAEVVVNEFWVDDAYDLTAQYIELYNDSASSASLDGLSLIVVTGDTSGDPNSPLYRRVDLRVDLSGSMAAHGYYLVGAGLVPNPDATFTLGYIGLGSITIALVQTSDILYSDAPTNRHLSSESDAAITTWVAAHPRDAVATVNSAIDHVYFNATNIGGVDSTHSWDVGSRETDGSTSWRAQDNYTLIIELGDPINDRLSSPRAANGYPDSTKWGACCTGTSCAYVLASTCTGGGKVYKHNWRDCTTYYNPCSGPDCSTIAQARAGVLESPFRLCNVTLVNKVDVTNDPNTIAYHVQDASGTGGDPRGIQVFASTSIMNTVFSGVNEGDTISIEGTTSEDTSYNLELVDNAVLALSRTAGPTAGSMPAPRVITLSELLNPTTAEPLESCRVKVNCVEFISTGAFVGGGSYAITDGTAYASVYVPSATTVTGSVPTGLVSITGIIAQYRPYELLLLHYSGSVPSGDIGVAACTATGGCCLPNASCLVLSQSLCENYHFGIYKGDGTDCTPPTGCTPITTGACWIPDTQTCSVLNQTDCESAGGGWAGPGVPCSQLHTIAEVRALPLGVNTFIREALVSNLTDITNGSGVTYHVQDKSGPDGEARGIGLYGSGTSVYAGLKTSTTEGVSRIMVRGLTADYAGMSELSAYNTVAEVRKIWSTPGNLGLSAPRTVTLQQILDPNIGEAVESTWIEVPCVEFEATGVFAGGGAAGNFWVHDASGNEMIARVGASDNPLAGKAIPTGFKNTRGIAGQFDDSATPALDGYQIQLRKESELNLPCSDVCNTCGGDLNADGAVNAADLSLLGSFVNSLLGLGGNPNPCADVDGNGVINGLDIQLFVNRVLDGWDCVQPPAGTIEITRCDIPTDNCPIGSQFCEYTIVDSAETQAMLAGLTTCVPGVLTDGWPICVLCTVPDGECPPTGTYQVFRWKEGLSGQDCYFVGASDYFSCYGWDSCEARFTVVP
jgi:hypothetical protein